MTADPSEIKLIFHFPFDERAADEARARGYLSHVSVEVEDGSQYAVFFYDPVRLGQDLEEMTKHGSPCIGDPGMIVVPEVTMDYMNKAIAILAEQSFFSYFRQIRLEPSSDPIRAMRWPPEVA